MTTYLILRSATRQEPKAVRSLKEAGYNAYCPERTVRDHLARDKTATRQMSLFPGYLFVEKDDRYGDLCGQVFDQGLSGVHAFLWVHGSHQKRPATVPGRLVDELRAAQEAGAFDDSKPKPKWRPKKGQRVQIAQGPFSGFSGEVMEVIGAKGDARVRVLMEMFGRSSPAEFKAEQVRAA